MHGEGDLRGGEEKKGKERTAKKKKEDGTKERKEKERKGQTDEEAAVNSDSPSSSHGRANLLQQRQTVLELRS